MTFVYRLSFDFPFLLLSVNCVALGHYLKAINDGVLPKITWPNWLPNQLRQLILKMLRFDPNERCKISEVCSSLMEIPHVSGKLTD